MHRNMLRRRRSWKFGRLAAEPQYFHRMMAAARPDRVAHTRLGRVLGRDGGGVGAGGRRRDGVDEHGRYVGRMSRERPNIISFRKAQGTPDLHTEGVPCIAGE